MLSILTVLAYAGRAARRGANRRRTGRCARDTIARTLVAGKYLAGRHVGLALPEPPTATRPRALKLPRRTSRRNSDERELRMHHAASRHVPRHPDVPRPRGRDLGLVRRGPPGAQRARRAGCAAAGGDPPGPSPEPPPLWGAARPAGAHRRRHRDQPQAQCATDAKRWAPGAVARAGSYGRPRVDMRSRSRPTPWRSSSRRPGWAGRISSGRAGSRLGER